jgi:hypothetical protein
MLIVCSNVCHDILTRTRGAAELWMRKGAMFHVRKFIITLLNIHFLSEVMFIFADQSYFPLQTISILIFEMGIHSVYYYVFQSLTVFFKHNHI